MTKLRFVEWACASLAAVACFVACVFLLFVPFRVTEYFANSEKTLVYTTNWVQQGGPFLHRAIILSIAYVLLSSIVAVSAVMHVRRTALISRQALWVATALLIVSAIMGVLVQIPESSVLILPGIGLALIASIAARLVPTPNVHTISN